MTHLSVKVAFLVAITSARRVSELGAIMADPLIQVFTKTRFPFVYNLNFSPRLFLNSISNKVFTYLHFS